MQWEGVVPAKVRPCESRISTILAVMDLLPGGVGVGVDIVEYCAVGGGYTEGGRRVRGWWLSDSCAFKVCADVMHKRMAQLRQRIGIRDSGCAR